MKAVIDTHTHTIMSGHAYSTVLENVHAAAEKGISLLGITEHAPAMHGAPEAVYFSNFKIIPKKIDTVSLYMGVELNIMDYDGTVDLSNEMLKQLDIVIASLHPPCIPFGTLEENTNALLMAMENPFIHVIGHPGDPRYPIDVEAVVKAAAETGTILEMNNASLTPGGFRAGSDKVMKEILILCRKQGIPVLMGSDAHFCTQIGEFDYAEALFAETRFPDELVLNYSVEAFIKALDRKKAV